MRLTDDAYAVLALTAKGLGLLKDEHIRGHGSQPDTATEPSKSTL